MRFSSPGPWAGEARPRLPDLADLIRVTAALCATAFLLSNPVLADDSGSDRISELEAKVEGLAEEIERLREEEREGESGTPDASDDPPSNAEVEQKVNVLARELDRLKRAVAVPEDKELKSVYGMGPAASKVYLRDRGLSLGGYGEANFSAIVSDKEGRDNIADALRAVIYLGYKFNDWIVLNSEYEFEHGTTGSGGSASVEFMTLDFLLHDAVNVKVGLLLTPMGFINEIHEPTSRPWSSSESY